jgi:N12 class adenine-specific DNA methylase
LPVNQYFIDNPDMILGELVEGNKLYGGASEGTQVNPFPDSDLKEQLHTAVSKIQGKINTEKTLPQKQAAEIPILAPLDSRKFSYCVYGDKIYWRAGEDTMTALKLTDGRKFATGIEIPRKYEAQLKALISLADNTRGLLDLQSKNTDGDLREAIDTRREGLNREYDSFTEKYGRICDTVNQKLLKKENNGYLLSALEILNGNGEFVSKAPICFEDVIKPRRATRCQIAMEVLLKSKMLTA